MKTALVIIDIQNDYFPGGRHELAGTHAAADKAAMVLAAARAKALPVVHVRHISTYEGATFFLEGSEGSLIHECVAPLAGETVIIKNMPNSFVATDLEAILREANIDTIVFCGMMSHMCVDSTVRAAADCGFSCIVAHDACTTRDLVFAGETVAAANVHTAFMAALDGVFAKVLRAEEAVGMI